MKVPKDTATCHVSHLVPCSSFTNNSSNQLIVFGSPFIYIYSLLQAFRIITNHSHLKAFKIPKTSLETVVIFSNPHNNGVSFTCYQKGLICSKSSIFESSGCTKGPSCSLCWRENEAVCDPCVVLEPTFIPGLVE